jgi:hypothetical protein
VIVYTLLWQTAEVLLPSKELGAVLAFSIIAL